MFFPLPSPLRFFFGSFLAHLPFVFPLSSEPIFYNPKFYNDMARPGLKGTRRVPKTGLKRAESDPRPVPCTLACRHHQLHQGTPGYPGVLAAWVMSDICSDVVSDVRFGLCIQQLFWHSVWHAFWHFLWHSIWHISWQRFWHMAWHDTFFTYTAHIRTFFSSILI